MNKKSFKIVIFIIVLLIMLLGCSASLDKQATPDPCLIPNQQPAAGKAVVSGKLVSTTKDNISEKSFYLLKNSTDGQSDLPPVMVLSFTSSPRAVLNECGNFIFTDVEPATYAMALWAPSTDAVFIMTKDKQDYVWVHAEAGKSLDMGHVDVP